MATNPQGHGGYRRPANPASVSGPGRLSRRTDGRPKLMELPDSAYGEGQEFREIQQGAQLGAGAAGTTAPGPTGVDPSVLTPLDAPTGRPDEPITAGAPVGPGIGPEAIGLGGGDRPEDVERLRAYLPAFIAMANRPESSADFRRFVRTLRAKVSGQQG